MLIGIDASKSAAKNRTGVENFTYQLILGLGKLNGENEFNLYTNTPLPRELYSNFNFSQRKTIFKRFFNKLFLPLLLLRYRPDVYFQPLYSIPMFTPKKCVGVVHDLAFHKFPEAYSKSEIASQESSLSNIIKKSQKIACVSNSTKNDLLVLFPETKDKIEIIYPSCDQDAYHPIEKPKDPLGVGDYYFLFLGRLEERKNILKIVEAFGLLKEEIGLPHKLVLAGKQGYGYDKIAEKIASLDPNIAKQIIMPGFVEQADMPDLMSGATAFIYPSLYEGFGIPVLEAMAAGTPVITANTSSLPEVVGDAAILVSPTDTDGIKDAMRDLATSPEKRNSLIEKGFIRIKEFSWEKSAQKLITILETL